MGGLDQCVGEEQHQPAERAVEQEGEEGEADERARAEQSERHHRLGAAPRLDPQEGDEERRAGGERCGGGGRRAGRSPTRR